MNIISVQSWVHQQEYSLVWELITTGEGRKVSELPKRCQGCNCWYEFDKYSSGSCFTCNKSFLCQDCCWTHDCIPGKARRLAIITNPKWICNLRKTLESNKE